MTPPQTPPPARPPTPPPTCALCGVVRDESDPLAVLTWTTSVEDGRTRAFCGPCSRRHLRAIEAKLDSQHW